MAKLILSGFSGAVIAAAAFAALSAPAQALTNEEIGLLSGPNRQATLEEGAKKEGALVWYCTLRADVGCRPLSDALNKKYPYLKISYIASQSEEILQRSLAESRARNVQVDVMQASLASALDGTNLGTPFKSPEASHFDPVMIDKDGMWAAIWTVWNGISWNTKRIASANAPHEWADILDAKYKDLMFWQSGSAQGAPRVITHFRMMYGEDGALDFLKKLARQNVRTAPGDAGAMVVGVVSGEYPIMLGQPLQQISPDKLKGAPVDGINPSPAMARSSGVAFIKGAPHPNAAMLFIDFLMSEDGQKVLATGGYNPTRIGVSPMEENKWFDPQVAGKKQLGLSGTEEKAWNVKSVEIYQDLFR